MVDESESSKPLEDFLLNPVSFVARFQQSIYLQDVSLEDILLHPQCIKAYADGNPLLII